MEYSGKYSRRVDDRPRTAGSGAADPMRVVLVSQSGTIHTMWLPDTLEGRYKFQDDGSAESQIPLYIEAEHGEWISHAGRGAAFILDERHSERSVPLCDRMITRVRYKGQEYVLYVEAERPGDYVFLPYYLEERADYMIGRNTACDICYPNESVSREHALLRWHEDAWYIMDQNSTNGTYVNGRKIESARLQNGDVVFIAGLYILAGSGFMAMNNANHRIELNTPRIRHIQGLNDVVYPHDADTWMAYLLPELAREDAVASADEVGLEGMADGFVQQDAAAAADGYSHGNGRQRAAHGQLPDDPHLPGLPRPDPGLHGEGAQGIRSPAAHGLPGVLTGEEEGDQPGERTGGACPQRVLPRALRNPPVSAHTQPSMGAAKK